MKSSFTLQRTIKAPVGRVFDAFVDHRAYAEMTPMRKSSLEKEGEPAPNGVGAVRRLELVGPAILEEVTGYERPSYFAYKAVKGLPVKEHLGEVRLSETGEDCTRVHYTISYTPSIPGPVVGIILKQAVGGLLRGIAKSVE
ncbi:MAG: hypothetical protein QOI80_2608 [Solirubrobacteraceae bacterium]|jgi:uncharacterized protein YndB with AHSA1/START domain|nr:hypothetical protein [Solirubrobacteraceae bacterium]